MQAASHSRSQSSRALADATEESECSSELKCSVVGRLRERPVLAGFTFLSFLLFGFLEIGLRSTEQG